mgnify:CR=1 FL=1
MFKKNYVLGFTLFIVLALPKVVIAEESTVDADQIKRLLCNILNQKNIPAYLKKMGTVEEDKVNEEYKSFISYTLKVRTELYVLRHKYKRSNYSQDMDKDSLAIRAKKQIFKSKLEAKNWLAPLGTTITEDDDGICALDDRFKDDDGEIEYRWEVSINLPELDGVSVLWRRDAKHTDRFCR